jgi:hypothetical protein
MRFKTKKKSDSDDLYDSYREQVKIDREALDDAVSNHAFLFMEVSERYTMAVSQRDKLKDEVKQEEARLFIEVRDSTEKMTNPEADARVRLDPTFMRLNSRYIDACQKVEKWGVLREAFAQRGYMLRELGNLFASQYWAKNSIDKPARESNLEKVRRSQRR